jgi:hypothetical protein
MTRPAWEIARGDHRMSTSGGRALCTVLSLMLGLSGLLAAQKPLPLPRLTGPLRIVRTTVFGLDLPIGRPTDAVLRNDDSVCITDMGFHRVSCWSAQGKHLFNTGRQGKGPGEFSLPYRIAAFSDGSLAILDMGAASFSMLSPTGKFVARRQLPIMFTQVNSLLALTGRRLAVSGYAPNAGHSADSAVHVIEIDTAARHVLSFGSLPTAINKDALNYWGAGRMTTAPDGTILYAQRIPYELKWHDGAGRVKRSFTVPATVSQSADIAFASNKTLSSTTVSVTANPVLAPGTALHISPGLVLAQRIGTRRGQVEEVWWDFIRVGDGKLMHSEKLPKEFDIVELIGVSRNGRAIFALGLLDDVPCVVRLDIELR